MQCSVLISVLGLVDPVPVTSPTEPTRPSGAVVASPEANLAGSNAPETVGPRISTRPLHEFTIAKTALVGAQERINHPNPLSSPSTAQLNFNKGNWTDWPWRSSGLSGDWFGARTALQDRGVFIDSVYAALLNQNFTGGAQTGFYGGGLFSTSITLDTKPLLDHDGGVFFFNFQHFHWYSNEFPSTGSFDPTGNYTGANQNLPTAAAMNQISQLYYSQQFLDGVLNLGFGKQDANNVFSNIPGTGGFQYSATGYSPTLNPYMPSFPNEATGLIAIVRPDPGLVASFGWFDGSLAGLDVSRNLRGELVYAPSPEPGPRGPATFFDNDGHWFLITEVGLNWQLGERQLPGAICAGGWLQTGRSQTGGGTLDAGPGVEDVPGAYLTANQTLWSPSKTFASEGGGFIAFGQFGWSDPNKNAVHWSLMAGLSATGVVPHRPMDAMGIMGAWTAFSETPGTWQAPAQGGRPGDTGGYETAFEAFYRIQVTPWAAIQPGLQFLGSPGGGQPNALGNAVTGYLFVELNF